MAAFRHSRLTRHEESRIVELLKLCESGELTLTQVKHRTGRSLYMIWKIAKKHRLKKKLLETIHQSVKIPAV